MAKQSNQKLKILYLLKILSDNTDSESGMTLSEISAELAKYNISAARKSLYDDIDSLRVFGVDVCVKRDRYVRYYINKREFSFYEIKYIVDALEGFSSVDPHMTEELVAKICKNFGVKGRTYYEKNDKFSPKMPTVICNEFNKNIECISQAIVQNKKIKFKEFVWNPQKQRLLKNDGKISMVTPIRLECKGKYRLIAFDGKSVRSYLVDRLLDVEPSDEKNSLSVADRERFLNEAENIECANVRIQFAKDFLSDIFERFGLGITVLSSNEGSVEASVKVKLDDEFYSWIFSNSELVKILSPENVCNEYKMRLLNALDRA